MENGGRAVPVLPEPSCHQPPHQRGDKAESRSRRKEVFEEVRSKALSFLSAHKLPIPQTREQQREVLKEIGRYLAATNFLTKNPDWLMSLPIIPGHDSRDEMEWRTTFDERLTFPIDALPFELRKFLTAADDVADLPASKAAASGAEGSRVNIKLTPAPARRWGVAYKYYRCPGRMWVAKDANGVTIQQVRRVRPGSQGMLPVVAHNPRGD